MNTKKGYQKNQIKIYITEKKIEMQRIKSKTWNEKHCRYNQLWISIKGNEVQITIDLLQNIAQWQQLNMLTQAHWVYSDCILCPLFIMMRMRMKGKQIASKSLFSKSKANNK